MTLHRAVVGGGLLGMATAYALARAGEPVVVFEAEGDIGGGAARGNAGWVCPTQVAPLAGPGVIARVLRNSLSPSSALHVSPRALPELAGFLTGMLRRSNLRDFTAAVTALAPLAKAADRSLRRLEELGLDLGWRRSGILSVFDSAAAAGHALGGLAVARQLGGAVPTDLLERAELLARTDLLGDRATHGFQLDGDGFLDPDLLLAALRSAAVAAGAVITTGSRVSAITREGAGWLLSLDDRREAVGEVYVAAGAWTGALLASAGFTLRLTAGKGYSFDVPTASPLALPLHLEQAHVVLTPQAGGRVRVAGTMELSGLNNALNPHRVDAIERAASGWTTGIDWADRRAVWVGPRPLTVDGLPVLGTLADGLHVLTGHGMYGVTLAVASAEAFVDERLGRPHLDLSAFRPARGAVLR